MWQEFFVPARTQIGVILLILYVPPEEAVDGFGQTQSVTSHKVRKDDSHLQKTPPKPNLESAKSILNFPYT